MYKIGITGSIGTGKTTIINALSYALYGNALYNIKKDNLEFFRIRKDLKTKATYFKNNYDSFDYKNNILTIPNAIF